MGIFVTQRQAGFGWFGDGGEQQLVTSSRMSFNRQT